MVIELIASLDEFSPPLRDLNLSRNSIGDSGATALAKYIPIHYHLKTLKISWNKIKSKGGIAIAESLIEG